MAFSTDLVYLSNFITTRSIIWLLLMLVSYALTVSVASSAADESEITNAKLSDSQLSMNCIRLRISVRKETPTRPEPK